MRKTNEIFQRNASSGLYYADSEFEFIMQSIADKPRLICYKSVENDKILRATYTLLRFMYSILGYIQCKG